MINAQIEIIAIASLTAIACSLPGTFLVLRRLSMMADAISHSVILGIVVAFFLVRQIDSPFLLMSAALAGVVTVLLVEALIKTKLVKEDAAIGVTYPLLFSIAVVMISRFATQIHIDTDAVLMGELAFAALNRFIVAGRDIGPVAVYQIGGVMVFNILLTALFYKEIRLAVFDEGFARVSGFSPRKIHYGLMVVTAVTTVAAFEVAGAIMVVGFIVGPAVVAAYFSKRLWVLLLLAPLVGILASFGGYSLAHIFDVSIAGSIVSTIGIMFLFAAFFAPRGFFPSAIRKRKLKKQFQQDLLLVHLLQHELSGEVAEENNLDTVRQHFGWHNKHLELITEELGKKSYITKTKPGLLNLTPEGIKRAHKAMERKA